MRLNQNLNPISKPEIGMIVYGTVCTFVVMYYMSESVLLSICATPMGVASACITLIFHRHLLKITYPSVLSPKMQVIGASIMPTVMLIMVFVNAWSDHWAMAGAHLMLFGVMLFVMWQQLTYRPEA